MRLAAAIALAALAATECPGGGGPVVPGPWDYAAFGDSVPAGTASEVAYPDVYARLTEGRTGVQVRVHNLAISGSTSEDLRRELRGDRESRRAVGRARLVTMTIGGNDLTGVLRDALEGRCPGEALRGCLEDALDAFERNWAETLDELLGLVREGPVAVRTTNYYDPFLDDPAAEAALDAAPVDVRAMLVASNDRICEMSRERGVPCADVYRAFNGPDGTFSALDRGLLAEDRFHPSAEGQRLIARTLRDLGYAPLA
ncbi:MAG: SGNH/GDSL hydrolase family protein [Actinomycetota bacterium]|nr:SGNH/GDSL hydrolase family protein [Actinomycetota bacterium]